MTDDIVSQWRNGLRILHRAHEQATADFARRGRVLSVATLVLTTIVGTSIFATLNSSPATAWKVAAGLISLTAAVLAALQSFLLYPELAERHRQTASKVGDLRRQLDVLVATGAVTTDGLQEIRARWDEVLEDAPVVPERLYQQAERDVLAARSSPAAPPPLPAPPA